MAHDPQTSYDRVAKTYASKFIDELSHKPFDRWVLDWLIEKVGHRGPICDLGCGPGQVAGWLHSRGAETCGIDISPKMVAEASRLNPGIPFEQGDMLRLDRVEPGRFGGIAAFYSLIHVPPDDLNRALTELQRVLRPGGVLLLAFHIGGEVRHFDEWMEKPVNLDFHFFTREQIKAELRQAGYLLEEAIERDPYLEIEYPSRRAYVFARRPV